MRNLMTINRDQIFGSSLIVDNLDVLGVLTVAENVNNFDLEFERNNTVMVCFAYLNNY
jgi:hypothetical protein